jgi:hypothetical protein
MHACGSIVCFFNVSQQFSTVVKGVQAFSSELAHIRSRSMHWGYVPHIASVFPDRNCIHNIFFGGGGGGGEKVK